MLASGVYLSSCLFMCAENTANTTMMELAENIFSSETWFVEVLPAKKHQAAENGMGTVAKTYLVQMVLMLAGITMPQLVCGVACFFCEFKFVFVFVWFVRQVDTFSLRTVIAEVVSKVKSGSSVFHIDVENVAISEMLSLPTSNDNSSVGADITKYKFKLRVDIASNFGFANELQQRLRILQHECTNSMGLCTLQKELRRKIKVP